VASSRARQRKLARAKMERQLARRAAKVRRQRQGSAIAVVSVVAVLGIAGTAWALGAFDKAKPKPAAASCTWNDTGGNATELKDVGKPPETGQQRTGTETMTITTNLGVITASLDVAKAPCTSASFAYLAGKNFYANAKCHRLMPKSYRLQCGDPTGTGAGGPGYSFGIENAPANGDYPTGTLAMARASSPHSNGSQFFMVYQDTKLPTQGGGYSIFGKVTNGLKILDQLAAAGVAGGGSDGVPAQPISILDVSVQKG